MDNKESEVESLVHPQANKSSNMKLFLGVGIAVVALATVILIAAGQSSTNSRTSASKNPIIETSKPPQGTTSRVDSQLEKDTLNIDDNIKNLDSDVNEADKGLNDQPVNLSQ